MGCLRRDGLRNKAAAGPEIPAPVVSEASPPPVEPGQLTSPQGDTVLEPASAPTLTGVALNDAQIAKISDVVNSGEIEQAQLARQRAKAAKVKTFAAHMLKEHTRAKEQGTRLAKQIGLMPEQSAISEGLMADGAKTLEALKSVGAADFDAQYADAQLTAHRKVLAMLDSQMIPQATSAELKLELQKARDMVEAHLNEAQKLADAR